MPKYSYIYSVSLNKICTYVQTEYRGGRVPPSNIKDKNNTTQNLGRTTDVPKHLCTQYTEMEPHKEDDFLCSFDGKILGDDDTAIFTTKREK